MYICQSKVVLSGIKLSLSEKQNATFSREVGIFPEILIALN